MDDKIIKLTETEYMRVATKAEREYTQYIHNIDLLKTIALRWCDKNGYKLGYYIGNFSWDATK